MNSLFFPICINLIGWGCGAWVFYCIGYAIPRKRRAALLAQTSPDAMVRSIVMICHELYERPGVAQIRNGVLCLSTVDGLVFQTPLEQVKVIKICTNNRLAARWSGQQITIHLDTPETVDLSIGVKQEDAVLWEKFLKITD